MEPDGVADHEGQEDGERQEGGAQVGVGLHPLAFIGEGQCAGRERPFRPGRELGGQGGGLGLLEGHLPFGGGDGVLQRAVTRRHGGGSDDVDARREDGRQGAGEGFEVDCRPLDQVKVDELGGRLGAGGQGQAKGDLGAR